MDAPAQTGAHAGRDARPASAARSRDGRIAVWDPFVRIFHWSLLTLFVVAYLTHDLSETIHQGAGYGIAVLVVLRVVWGLVGSRHARFRDFVYRPTAVLRFLIATARFKAPRHVGHNPAGGAMVLALLLNIAVICGSGIMMTMDRFWGQKWIEEVHETAVHVCIGLIVLHVLGVIAASLEHRENLVRSMVTGWKRGPAAPAGEQRSIEPTGPSEPAP
ncbi:MAG TPA: cytochrome b/b6 domain-containing protein [Hyphomicrobiaceae bacterium]|nr:cytochrome b/b6 domain-containing protein [Hyphomicrobiaceae bacterium]